MVAGDASLRVAVLAPRTTSAALSTPTRCARARRHRALAGGIGTGRGVVFGPAAAWTGDAHRPRRGRPRRLPCRPTRLERRAMRCGRRGRRSAPDRRARARGGALLVDATFARVAAAGDARAGPGDASASRCSRRCASAASVVRGRRRRRSGHRLAARLLRAGRGPAAEPAGGRPRRTRPAVRPSSPRARRAGWSADRGRGASASPAPLCGSGASERLRCAATRVEPVWHRLRPLRRRRRRQPDLGDAHAGALPVGRRGRRGRRVDWLVSVGLRRSPSRSRPRGGGLGAGRDPARRPAGLGRRRAR